MSKHDDVPRDAAGEIDPTGERTPEERRVRFYRALRDAGYSDLTIVRREDVANEFKRKLRRIPSWAGRKPTLAAPHQPFCG